MKAAKRKTQNYQNLYFKKDLCYLKKLSLCQKEPLGNILWKSCSWDLPMDVPLRGSVWSWRFHEWTVRFTFRNWFSDFKTSNELFPSKNMLLVLPVFSSYHYLFSLLSRSLEIIFNNHIWFFFNFFYFLEKERIVLHNFCSLYWKIKLY